MAKKVVLEKHGKNFYRNKKFKRQVLNKRYRGGGRRVINKKIVDSIGIKTRKVNMRKFCKKNGNQKNNVHMFIMHT